MTTVIIKYNAGNTASVQFSLERLGVSAIVSDNASVISSADKVIFPGVGEASSAMRSLRQSKLDEVIRNLKQPVLGICLGMQLLCKHSEEGNTTALGIFDTIVRKMDPSSKAQLKVPHVGWNSVTSMRGKLFEGINDAAFVYYVHGYRADVCQRTNSTTDYIDVFSAGLEKNNFYGVQFHPEKSGDVGERILRNFLKI